MCPPQWTGPICDFGKSLSQLYLICFFKVGVRMCFAQYHFDEDNLISMLVAIFFPLVFISILACFLQMLMNV